MDAKLIACVDGKELRKATRADQTWPGYDTSCPLGRIGFWLGTHRSHRRLRWGEAREILAQMKTIKKAGV